MTANATLRRAIPSQELLMWGAPLLLLETVLVGWYVAVVDVQVTDSLVLVYPWVWINVGLWAFGAIDPPRATVGRRYAAAIVAVAYFGVLAAVGGILGPGHALHGHTHGGGVAVAWPLPPGWGPAILYNGDLVQLLLEPYKVLGYTALAYLVYVTVLDAAGSAITGIVGLFSCVSCTWPVLGTVLTSLLGSGSAVAAFAANQPYAASTIVFVSAAALLAWRPVR